MDKHVKNTRKQEDVARILNEIARDPNAAWKYEAGRGKPTNSPDPKCRICDGDGLEKSTRMYYIYCRCQYRRP